jgi:hypothetical protein
LGTQVQSSLAVACRAMLQTPAARVSKLKLNN